jgi:hypothetical protein
MARLSEYEWEKVKADWSTGKYSLMELATMHNVSNAAISKKAKAENWQRLDPAIVDAFIDARAEATIEVNRIAKVNKVNAVNLQHSLNVLGDEKAMIHEDMTEIRTMMMGVVRDKRDAGELSTVDCKVAMETAAKEHEVKFGKSPDTAFQFNQQINGGNIFSEAIQGVLDEA